MSEPEDLLFTFDGMEGERLALEVWIVDLDNPECEVHAFRRPDRTSPLGVFFSDCLGWESAGFDIHHYLVALSNLTESPIKASLASFTIEDRNGKTHRPNRVAALAGRESFPLNRSIEPGESLIGWVYFDDRPDFVPKTITYRSGAEELSVVFSGEHEVFPKG